MSDEQQQDAEYWKDLAYRNQATLENLKRRHQRDLQVIEQKTTTRLVTGLLGGLDNLQRATQHGVDGSQQVWDELQTSLLKLGVQTLDPVGEQFDPTVHEAITTQITTQPDGTVVECLSLGYRTDDALIRAASVIVGVNQAGAQQPSTEPSVESPIDADEDTTSEVPSPAASEPRFKR